MMRQSNESRRTVTVRIEGRVQGVYYRAWTEENARALGLDGLAVQASLSDGPVHLRNDVCGGGKVKRKRKKASGKRASLQDLNADSAVASSQRPH